jgi:predicted dehydrogenase
MRVLQIGLGNFGLNHLRAWQELGVGDALRVAERLPTLHDRATALRFPADHLASAVETFWADADVIDIVTGTDSHHALCRRALLDGKDVFVEKPMTMTAAEALEIARLVREHGRILQVGYYYRYHPISVWLRQRIAAGELGQLRYLSGSFLGFKRARNDVGVMHTDGIHFIDLFNFLTDAFPEDVYAVTRDHFGRGLEDFAIALMTYPGEIVARVEAGYIQPGEWRDKVVAGAMTTKSITVVGSTKTVVADYETEKVIVYDVHHELRDGTWTAVQGDAIAPALSTASPLEQIKAELSDFLASVRDRRAPSADSVACGVNLALTIEALYQSARTRSRVQIATGQAAVSHAAHAANPRP